MINPRATRLVRVPDLRAMQRAVIELAELAGAAVDRTTAVIVPTTGAALELQRTIENLALPEQGRSTIRLPALVTRAEFYSRLWSRLPGAPPLLTDFEREVLFRLGARSAEKTGAAAPFRLRAGLVVEILRFYDELRRNFQTIDDFHRLLSRELTPAADTDRGAERLLRQTEFLAAAFAEFERLTAESGGMDEHGLRAMLLESAPTPAFERVIVTTADQAADPYGLWAVDFDLLARMPGVHQIDLVATERVLASGFHARLHERHLPGIEEVRTDVVSVPPELVVPRTRHAEASAFTHTSRDREEELVAIARTLKDAATAVSLDRTAIAFQRPLPYLYLARHVFGGAHIPFQAMDALPLAGEPFISAFDLILSFVGSEATRAATIELLGSPHWALPDPESGQPVELSSVTELDAFLQEVRYLGGWERLRNLAGKESRVAGALRAALSAAEELQPVLHASRASAQLEVLRQFITRHERLPAATEPWYSRHLRARAALLAGLDGLREAHERHDDRSLEFTELAAALRRWIEGQTFAPRTGTSGVMLVDATAAAFSDVDSLRIVGLVDGDWPERSSKSIFYPSKLLEPLGWPRQVDRLAAARARFQDLLHLPAQEVWASSFSLEEDSLVAPSAFVEEIAAAGLIVREEEVPVSRRIFDHEALAIEPVDPAGASGEARVWLSFREQLPSHDAAQFHGAAGRREPGIYAVSRVERYLECPFKYFAANVLRLDEEREVDSGLTPQERGQFLHEVFEAFFAEWNASGVGAITTVTLDRALAMFEKVAEGRLGQLREADRALERTYLLGSAVAPGLAERAFACEIEHGVGVAERLLEHALEGTFAFAGPDGPRHIQLRAKADRIDLLDDGTLRIVDYKIGRAPRTSRSLQLAIYSVCAEQQLDGKLGRTWSVSRAGYIAFREKNAFVSIGVNLEKALAEGQLRLVSAVTGIEEGTFPPRPEEPWLCSRCGYAMVCRKDYVGDE